MKMVVRSFDDVVTLENLMHAFERFQVGKKYKKDVTEFTMHFFGNILLLYQDLISGNYTHGTYTHLTISDPKKRDIHKSSVRDRVVHHLIYTELYAYFDRKFIHDSYSCRTNKGTHRALKQFQDYARKVSKNNTKTCWILKCDIKKFFASIDHNILKQILHKHIHDYCMIGLLENIIDSFHTAGKFGVGLPLGNLTSQLFVNVYMNEFDQFVKHHLKWKYYIRYADDFVFFSDNREKLEELLLLVRKFLWEQLRLELHPDKVFIKTVASGVDFLGWIHFPHHRVLRTVTKRRMVWKSARVDFSEKARVSYMGLLHHGNAWKLMRYLGSEMSGKS